MGAIFCSPRVVAHTRGTFFLRTGGHGSRSGFRYEGEPFERAVLVSVGGRRAEALRLSEGPHRRTPGSETYILPERAINTIQNISTLNVIQ